MIGNSKEYDTMAAVESQHWWYANLHRQVIQAVQKHHNEQQHLNQSLQASATQQGSSLKPVNSINSVTSTQPVNSISSVTSTQPVNSLNHTVEDRANQFRILDAGCGTGGLLMALKQAGFDYAHGFDLSTDAVAHAQARGLNATLGDLNHIAQWAPPQSFDVIVNNDTLYHLSVEQRNIFFKACLSLLKPNGIMILNVPALNAFKGNHDRAVGITERFSKSTLVPFILSTGFEVKQACYWPFVLSPIIWLTRALQKRVRQGDASTAVYQSDLALPNPLVNKLLALVCAVEQKVPIKTPWGSSLFFILQKPHHF